MQPIRIIIARRSEYIPGDAFEVFGDRATGTVDFDHSLTTRAVPLWLEAPPVAAHLLGGHLLGVHLDGVFPAGHLEGVHLSDTHLVPESVVVWESEAYVFGRFQHVLKMADVVGNRSTGPWPTFTDTVNSAPRPPWRFEKTGYDAMNDQVIFSIEPRLPLAEAN